MADLSNIYLQMQLSTCPQAVLFDRGMLNVCTQRLHDGVMVSRLQDWCKSVLAKKSALRRLQHCFEGAQEMT